MRLIIPFVDYSCSDDIVIITVDKKEEGHIDQLFDLAFSDVRCNIGEIESGDFIFRCPRNWRKGMDNFKIAIENNG